MGTIYKNGKRISNLVLLPNLQSGKTVSPTTENQKVTADSGYDGLSDVTVNAVDSSIDSNITAENIKSGVSILGVSGTLEGAKEEETKTLALSMASGNQVITPTSGKVMNKVTITKPSTLLAENIKSGVNIGGVTGTYTGSGGSIPTHSLTLNVETYNLTITDIFNFEYYIDNDNIYSEIIESIGNIELNAYAIKFRIEYSLIDVGPLNISIINSNGETLVNIDKEVKDLDTEGSNLIETPYFAVLNDDTLTININIG